MKSIMQEASSISKAVDQAWTRAGKPHEFTIKVLEMPERNMFGLTVKSAKIAFFFDERKAATQFIKTAPAKESRKQPAPEPVQKKAPAHKKEIKEQRPPKKQSRTRWTPKMIEQACSWIDQMLKFMGKQDVSYKTATSTNGLTLTFNASLTGREDKDRLLFASFAHLILATLRHKNKKPLTNFKVILLIQKNA